MMITIGFIAALLPWVWWDSSIDVQMASLPLSLLDFLLVMDIEFQLIGLCYLVGLVLCASRTFRPMLAGTILALTSIALFVIKLYSMNYVFSGGWMIRIDSIGIGVVVASVAVLLLIPFAYHLHLDEKLKKA